MYFIESNADCFLPNGKGEFPVNDYMIEQLDIKDYKKM